MKKTKGVVAKRRALSRHWMAFLIFGVGTIVGGVVGNGIVSLFNLTSLLGPLGAFTGIVIVLPVTFLLYRYLSKRFVHQQIG